MDNILSQLQTAELDIKLTEDKLYLKTLTSQETFALRGVQGIGVVDLVDDYNKALTEYKTQMTSKNFGIAFIVVGVILILFVGNSFSMVVGLILGGGVSLTGLMAYLKANKFEEPTLMSAVQIMMSGGIRNFTFDKAHINSTEVANFISKVESTLSAYHKN